MSTSEAKKELPEIPEPQKEHLWLQKLVGEWTYTSSASMGPDMPPESCSGTESIRSLGDLWVLAEARGEMPGGGTMISLLTLGYEPENKRFVGTFIASAMTKLWVYEDGQLDASEKVLTMSAEGPDFTQPGKTAKYRDVIEFKSDDHRVMSSHALGDDGQWHQFMEATYRRRS